MKEDHESWRSFFIWLKEHGLTGVRLVIGDKDLGMLETVSEVFPDAKYQRCIVHFYRNVFSVVLHGKVRSVAMMLKAIHAQESKKAPREKAVQVAEKLRKMKLQAAAKKLRTVSKRRLHLWTFRASIGRGSEQTTRLNGLSARSIVEPGPLGLFQMAIVP